MTGAETGGWLPVRLGLVSPMAPALVRWREAHRALVSHIKPFACDDCGVELCPDGQALWDRVEQAERDLPWRLEAA